MVGCLTVKLLISSVLMKKNAYSGNVFLISMKARQSTSIVLQLDGVFPILSS